MSVNLVVSALSSLWYYYKELIFRLHKLNCYTLVAKLRSGLKQSKYKTFAGMFDILG